MTPTLTLSSLDVALADARRTHQHFLRTRSDAQAPAL